MHNEKEGLLEGGDKNGRKMKGEEKKRKNGIELVLVQIQEIEYIINP